MSTFYEQFDTDNDAEVKGIDLDFGDAGTITIARAGGSNKKYAAVLKKLSAPYKRQIEHGLISAEAVDSLLVEVFVDSVVLGWKGVKDKQGNPLKYSKKAATELFLELPELFEVIREESSKAANFRKQELEEDAKN